MEINKKRREPRHEEGFFLKRIIVFFTALALIMICAYIGDRNEELFDRTVPFIIFGGFLPAVWAVFSILIGLIPGTSKLERARKKRTVGHHEVCLLQRGSDDTRPLEVILEELRERYKPRNPIKPKEMWTPFKWPRRQDTIWWDEEKFDKYRRKFPEMKYSSEFGRIFLDTVWFIDGDEKEEAVKEWTKEIERRGGFIRTDISGKVTNTLVTPSYDKTGYNLKSTVKYGGQLVTIEEYEDLIAIAERTREYNKALFTQDKLFNTTKNSLEIVEEEQGVRYLFMHESGDGLVFVWLEEGQRRAAEWDGENTEEFWKKYGELLTKMTIVTPRPKERCIKRLADKLKAAEIKVPHFAYIDLVFYTGATLRHEDKAVLGDMKKLTVLLGQEPPEKSMDFADAVCSVFMTLIIDNGKNPKEYMGCYFG